MPFKRKLALLLTPFVAVGLVFTYLQARASDVEAVDPLTVSYNGDMPPDPMFEIFNMLPGDFAEKFFTIKNTGSKPIKVDMFAIKTSEEKAFSAVLDVEITDLSTANIIFSGKLTDLFSHPPFDLGSLDPGNEREFRVRVDFPQDADNTYQNAKVIFTVKWVSHGAKPHPEIELPDECSDLAGKITNVIHGTNRSDFIRGTSQGDLIFAEGGNDKIYARSGDDCIVAGDGNDWVLAGGGDDIVVGGAGNDSIDSQSGDDTIFGNAGKDKILAGSGNDKVDAGSGKDTAYGGSGNDYLDGGPNHDKLNGGAGYDTCVNGENLFLCEL